MSNASEMNFWLGSVQNKSPAEEEESFLATISQQFEAKKSCLKLEGHSGR